MATTCNVRQNAIDYLKNKKVINDYMTIVSPLFYLENDKLTNYAKQKYGLKTEGSLFKSRRIVKQDIIRGGNAIPVNDVYKVDVNEELFKELQEQYDIVEQRKEELKPTKEEIDNLLSNINIVSQENLNKILKTASGNIRFDYFDANDKTLSDRIHNSIFTKKPVSEINKLISQAKNVAINAKTLPKGIIFSNKGYTIITNAKDFTDVTFDTKNTVKIKSLPVGKFNGNLLSGNIIAPGASEEFIKSVVSKFKEELFSIPKFKSILFSGAAPKKSFAHTALITNNAPLGYTLGVSGISWNIEIGDLENKFPKQLFDKFRIAHIGNRSLKIDKPLGWVGGKIFDDTLVITELQSDLLQNTQEIKNNFPEISRSSIENTYSGWQQVFFSTAIELMKQRYPQIKNIALPSSKFYTSKVSASKNISLLYDKLAKEYGLEKPKKQNFGVKRDQIIPVLIDSQKESPNKGFIIGGNKYEFKWVDQDYVLTNNKGFTGRIFNSQSLNKFIVQKAKGGKDWVIANVDKAKDVILNIINNSSFSSHFIKEYTQQSENLEQFYIGNLNSLQKPIENKTTQLYYDVYIKTYIKTFVKNMKSTNPDLGSDYDLANDSIDFLKNESFIKQYLESDQGVEYLINLNDWISEEFSTEITKDLINLSSEDEGEGGILVDSFGNEIEETYEESDIDKLVKESLNKKQPNDFLYTNVDVNYLLDELNNALKEKNKEKQNVIKQILTEIQSNGNSNLKFMYTDDGKILGFTYNNQIYVDKEAPFKTTIEEAAHLWIDKIKNVNPELYSEGINKVINSTYLQDVLSNPFYIREALKLGDENSQVYKEYLQEEALSKAIKDNGSKLNEDDKTKFKDWLVKLWSELKKILGFSSYTDEQIKKMSLEKFATISAKEAFEDLAKAPSKVLEVKPGVEELFNSNPELANQVYEALGFGKFRVSLGKELNPEQKFGSQGEPVVKKFEVLDENKKVIGFVTLDIAKDGSITAHPTLTVIGKGYGQELYQTISLRFGSPVIEWGPHNISKSPEGKKLWNSLEKKGLAKAKYQWDEDVYLRGIDLSQQKQQALQLYSQYLDTVFPDSKVKDIVYHGITSKLKEKFDRFSKEFITSGQGRYGEDGFFFSENKEEVNKNYNSSGLITAIINLKNTSKDIYKNTWKETVEYLTEPQEIYGGKTDLDYLSDGYRAVAWYKEGNWKKQVEKLKEDGWKIEETANSYIKLGKISSQEKTYYSHLKKNLEKGTLPFNVNNSVEAIKKAKEQGLDGLIYENVLEESSVDKHNQYVVFEPEQIHILGSKQDIEGFKDFVSGKDTVKTESLFNTNNKLANQVYEILGATEEQKSEAEQLYLIYRSNRNPNIEDGSEQDIQEFQKYFEELQDEYAEYDEAIDVYKAEKELFNDTETFGETFEEQDEDDGIEYQLTKDEPTVNQQPDQSIDEKIELFLQNIGVSLKSVNEIRDRNGNVVTDAIAKADMLNKIVEVVADRQLLDTLPEEAAHFFVNMLGENSPLYKQMFNKITDYKLYAETVEQYRKNKSYRKADGTLNIDKLKKEAVGKVIAQHIIGNDTGLETTQNVNFLLNWWNKVWNFVKSFFVKADENPFETSAQQILEGNVKELSDDYTENEEYYQLADPFGGLIADQENIKLDDSIDARTGQKRHIYTYKDKAAKGSVTTYYVDAWLKKIFRSDQRSEAQKLIDLAKADFGDDVHLQIKKIFDSWLNEDGTKRTVQKSVDRIVPAGPTYTVLNNYVKSVLDTYDNKTRFLTEIKIFDQQKRIAGSIDLLVYNQDGSVDIYDWKSQEIYKDQEDIKAYKEPMYRIQLENYKKILEKQYGFKIFNKVRAIPIRTQFSYKDGQLYNIINIEIGNIDPTKIPEEKSYLLPVTLKEEKTENEDLDVLIKKLNGIYSKIETSKYPNEEKYLKREELNQLRLAIRDLRLKTRIDKLITFGLTQHKKYSDLLEENKLTGKDAENAIRILSVFEQSSTLLSGIREEYLEVLKEKGDKKEISKYEAVNKNFSYMSGQVSSLIKKIQKYQNQKVKEKAESKGIKGILDPEAQLNVLAGNFQALSNINRTSFKLFSNLLRKSQAIRDSRYEAALKKLVQLKKEFKNWADSKGLSTTEAMNKILQLDEKGNWNGNFLAKHQAKFYTEREEAIKSGNVKWFLDNVDYDIEAYKEEEKKQRESLKKIQFFLDEKENKEAIEKKMKEWISLHRVIDQNGKINFTALSNRQNSKLVTPKEKWLSQKWIDLQKPENAPLNKIYNYFQELTTYSKKLGMLDGNVKGFIPSMANDKIDQLVFGQFSKVFSTKGFFDNLEVDSGTMYTPQIDPTDGTIVNTIPVYFTSDYGVKREDGTMDYSKKSRDLFKVFGVWAGHMYNYEAMQTLEDDAIMLLNVERNKPRLVTDSFNNVKVENGVVQAADKNDYNSKVLEDFVNYYLYNKQSGEVTDVAFKVGKKEYSLLKSVTAAIQWFSLKTLAFNPISGTANFVGGTGNTLFTAQKGIMYTKKTWAEAVYRVTSGNKKAKAALDYFSVLAEGKSEGLINDLSLSTVNKYVNTNNAFLIQRKLDKAVEQPSAVALMLEHMIEDGKIVSIQQFVKNKYNYNETFYNLSKSERKALRDKIDKEVGELKKTRSLLEVGTINKDGEFELPGIEKESDAYADFRSKIKGVNKKIIGNQTREDINRIRTTMLGGAMMQFRNWIPEMMEERFDGLKFDEELQTWTYGRARSFFGDIFSKRLPLLLKALATGLGETSTIELAKQKYQDLKAEAYEKGQAFDITEGEFVDLYIGNIKAFMTEIIVFTGLAISIMAVVGGDDDKKQGWKKYAARALKKYYNEFVFYYNPLELSRIIDKPLPVIGLATDMFNFIGAFSKETTGRLVGDEEWIKEAKPLKYFNKMIPIGKEAMMWMAVVDDDFRKEWDIRIQ